MARKQSKDSFSTEKSVRRLETILKGAFAGPPTPLKDIPKQNGKSRRVGSKESQRRRRRLRKERAA